jgi:hypothetical protein
MALRAKALVWVNEGRDAMDDDGGVSRDAVAALREGLRSFLKKIS